MLPKREVMIERVLDPAPRQLQGGPVYAGPEQLDHLRRQRDERAAEIRRREAKAERVEGDSSRARRVHDGQLARLRGEMVELARTIDGIETRAEEDARILREQQQREAGEKSADRESELEQRQTDA